MQYMTGARVTFEEIDRIRKHRNTDILTRFIVTLPLLLLTISVLFFYFAWQLLDANGVTPLNMFTQPIYQNGIDGKRSSIFLFIPLGIIMGLLFTLAAIPLYYAIKRLGRPPLIVSDTDVRFSAIQIARHQISHFEHQHVWFCGFFAAILNDGSILRFPTAFVIGAPVREFGPEQRNEIRKATNGRIFYYIAPAVILFTIFILFKAF